MKITGLDLRLVTLPYKAPIEWASTSETAGEYLILGQFTEQPLKAIAQELLFICKLNVHLAPRCEPVTNQARLLR